MQVFDLVKQRLGVAPACDGARERSADALRDRNARHEFRQLGLNVFQQVGNQGIQRAVAGGNAFQVLVRARLVRDREHQHPQRCSPALADELQL